MSRMYQNILILKYLYLYSLAWWMDGLVQIIMGLVGLAGNSMAVPILLSKKLNRWFYKVFPLYLDPLGNRSSVWSRAFLSQKLYSVTIWTFQTRKNEVEEPQTSSLSPCWSVLDFWKINLEKSSSMNWIFSPLRTGFLLPV